MLDLVGLLMMNDMIGVVLQVLRDSGNLIGKGLISWVDHLKLNYNMIILVHHILCLYCIHDLFVKWWIIAVHWCMWFINNWVHHLITCHNVYYYSLSRVLTFVSFLSMKHVLFYSWAIFRCWIWVGPRSNCGSLAQWYLSGYAWGLIVGFWRSLMVISILGDVVGLEFEVRFYIKV
jgi:hypothetical protein